jgi:hypothetical protein
MTAAVRTTKNDNGDGSGKDEAIVVYYDAGDDSDNAGVFVAVARAAVDAAATAANQGDNDADCNEDPSTCASPATATRHAIVACGGCNAAAARGTSLVGSRCVLQIELGLQRQGRGQRQLV